MNKLILLALLSAAALAHADPADELLSAQNAFRQALSTQNSSGSQIDLLKINLATAQNRMQQAQTDVTRLQTELQTAQAEKTQYDAALQAAGERLNAAWAAARSGQ